MIAGYVLFGLDWPARFKTLRLPAVLETAYRSLEQHFDGQSASSPADLVTIPKASRRTLPKAQAAAVAVPEKPALSPPSRLQLTHAPDDDPTPTPIEGDEP